jgi:two-component system, chemotaxis family, CheB/CheR fusion protein
MNDGESAEVTGGTDEGMEQILEYLKANRGFDFTGYKRSSLGRRIRRRMSDVGIDSYEAYLDHLEVHPSEFTDLFNTILINVTSFFRDPDSWESLREAVLERIIGARQASDLPIRVWSAACSSGQEPYTLAMLFAEELGADEFSARVKIYGTDVDEEDLERGRQALYTEDEIADVPDDLREKYFTRARDSAKWQFRTDLRRSLIFGRHDLVRDAPISRLDLLLCRNTLMYFNAEIQSSVLERFHFALNEGGYLFLGKAETLLTRSNLFRPVDMRNRIFQRVPRNDAVRPQVVAGRRVIETGGGQGQEDLVLRAFDNGPVPHLVLDRTGMLVAANHATRTLLGIRPADLGRPVQDLEISYRPLELRSMIDRARTEDMVIAEYNIEWPMDDREARYYDVSVQPLRDEDEVILGTAITFADVTTHSRLEDELRATNAQLETAYEELQSANEELETTNEELQSSNEELETTNEELQSANEELETINEELQSSNEELERANEELERRTGQLNETNAYLRSILRGIGGAIVVLDTDLIVQLWSHSAEEFWGVRTEEAQGQGFFDLDIGLPVEELAEVVRSALEGESELHELQLEGHDRKGREARYRARVTPLHAPDDDTEGVIVLLAPTDEQMAEG